MANPIKQFLSILLVISTFAATAQSTFVGIHHVRLAVRDLDRSVGFYTHTTGLKPVSRTNLRKPVGLEQQSGFAHVPRKVAVLQSANARLELVQFAGAEKLPPSPMPIPGPGITHVCYQSPAGVAIYEKVKAAGGSVVSRGNGPVDRGFGIRYTYLRDPDNLLFETEQLDKPKFTDSLWVGHVALVTPDIDRLVTFYQNLLGTPPANRVDNIKNSPKLDDIANIDGLRLRGAWFKVGNMQLEIWQFENPVTPQPTQPVPFTQIGYGQIGFEVSDLPADYARLNAQGVKFLSQPVSADGASAVYFRDPDGNLLCLISPKANAPDSVRNLKKLE